MSTHRERLDAAVAVFKELGWQEAATEDAATLPLGTPEQRAIAKAGLASGPWSRWGPDGKGRWGEQRFIDVNENRLGLFATRQGVSAQRAARLLEGGARGKVVADVVAERGAAFASAFVDAVSTQANRSWEGAPGRFAKHTLLMVARLGLPVPENVEYLRDFALLAAVRLSPQEWPDAREFAGTEGAGLSEATVLEPRFAEHARLAVELGVPASGPLPDALRLGLARGWLGRDEATELAMLGLQTAQRPIDRKAWVGFLAQPLALTPAELAARADELVPVLSLGEGPLIEALAPPLIAAVPDEQLPEVALGALTITTAKGRRIVLAALAGRGAPAAWVSGGADGLDELVASIVLPWASARDRSLAKAAAGFLEAWGLAGPGRPGDGAPGRDAAGHDAEGPGAAAGAGPGGREPGGDGPGGAGHGVVGQEGKHGQEGETTGVPGAWHPTPEPWDAPELVLAAPGVEAFRGAAAAVADGINPDVEGEVFLAQLNALARLDEEAARTEVLALAGGGYAVDLAKVWASRGAHPNYWGDPETVLDWRAHAVVSAPGSLPVLLSTPSRVDASVSGEALLGRLRIYAEEGAAAHEADLLAALLRLDHASVTAEQAAALRALEVPVVTVKGKDAGYTAGPLAADHVGDPVIEPGFTSPGRSGARTDTFFKRQRFDTPASLKRTKLRLEETPRYVYRDIPFTLLPFWGDALHAGASYDGLDPRAWIWRQLARRRSPLSPGTALNLLAAQRDGLETREAAGRALALREAWERGLLRPGTADARLLNWRREPERLASMARTLLQLGLDEGLGSVVWPVLDDFLGIAGAKTRMLAGASELAEAVLDLAPGAIAALGSGLAQARDLRLPGLRDLAARSGSSRAVRAAKEAVALLDAALAAWEEGPASAGVASAAGPGAGPGPGPDVGLEAGPGADPGEARPAQGGPGAGGERAPSGRGGAPSLSEADFAAAWDASLQDPPVVEDGVGVEVVESADGSTKRLIVVLTLPGEEGVRFRVDKGTYFGDLVDQRALQAEVLTADRDPAAAIPLNELERRKLHWDGEAGRLAAVKFSGKFVDIPLAQGLATLLLALVAQPGDKGTAALSGAVELAQRQELGPARVAAAMKVLLTQEAVGPARLAAATGRVPGLLAVFWPILTEAIAHAATLEGAPPRWLGGVLDQALDHAPVLREAAARGLMPAHWAGLEELAARPGKAAAFKKARELKEALA